mmetsp:Transcript_51134/g.159751  ORF Transcript_51134/g.159751 Transcript_51134/m.159751 type:complete len:93 (+) Transcript_51134:2003-2281(+)
MYMRGEEEAGAGEQADSEVKLSREALAHNGLKKCLHTVGVPLFLLLRNLPRGWVVDKEEVLSVLAVPQGLMHRDTVEEERVWLPVSLHRADG